MRIVIAAVLSGLLAGAYWLPLYEAQLGIELPPQFELYRNATLVALAVWLLIEGIVVTRRKGQLKGQDDSVARLEAQLGELKEQEASAQERAARAEKELSERKSRLETVESEKSAAEAKADELKSAYDDAKKRADDLEKRAKEAVGKAADQEVVNLLALLQSKGRFIDFIMDDVTKYPDAQIGAAARVVHQGCSSVIKEYFDIEPVLDSQEGEALTLEKDYDSRSYRLLGKVSGEPPFTGTLLHKGWQTKRISLPESVDVASAENGQGIIAPAEVELQS